MYVAMDLVVVIAAKLALATLTEHPVHMVARMRVTKFIEVVLFESRIMVQ